MKIKLKDSSIMLPFRAHEHDAGLDIYSPIDFTIEGHGVSDRIDLGFGIEIPEGYVGEICERSSQGKKGIITLGNTIDCGYTGFVHVTLANLSEMEYVVAKGDRICQLVVKKIYTEPLEVVEEFEATERGEGAHGSTGI